MKPISILKKLNEGAIPIINSGDGFRTVNVDNESKYINGSNYEFITKELMITCGRPGLVGKTKKVYTVKKDGKKVKVTQSKDEFNKTKNEILKGKDNLTESSILEEKPVYMNTWKNYNEYGADLDAYGIKDGWMTIDDALEFCKEHAEDEPFINDTDGVPIEISDYDNAVDKLNQLKKIEEADVDEDVFKAFIEEGSYTDVDEIIDKIESGDYIFFPDVDNDEDLAREYIDMCGGITSAVSNGRLEDYFDEEAYKEENEDDIRNLIAENEGYESIDDVTDEELKSYLDGIMEDEIANAKYSNNDDFFDKYFDYKAFGDELSFDYTYTSTGALCSY